MKTKKAIIPKLLALGLIGVALFATFFLYQKGDITLFPGREKNTVEYNFTIDLPIPDKKYTLFYQDKTNAFDIANFENGEIWYGDGQFDFSTYKEGESSLFLTSLNGRKASVTLKKNLDIEGVLNFKLLVYLAGEPTDIEELSLIIVDQNHGYRFPIRDLSKGWNLLTLPQNKFSIFTPQVDEKANGGNITVRLTSRPNARAIINLDSLWAEKDKTYLKDWNTISDQFLSLKKNVDAVSLLANSLYGSRATLTKGSAKDYTIQIKFNPQDGGEFGLFLRGDYQSGYGYYLVMNGVKTNGWRIYKYGLFEEKVQALELIKGEIGNFKMEKNNPYWLQAEMKGQRLVFSFSIDGQNFTKLGEANDASFTGGGVGFTVSGGNIFFIDEVVFFQ